MTKYIVKNCPCYELGKCNNEHIGDEYCQDCTDCPIKQVVEMCKDVLDHAEWCNCTHYPSLIKIFQTLDVQEVE